MSGVLSLAPCYVGKRQVRDKGVPLSYHHGKAVSSLVDDCQTMHPPPAEVNYGKLIHENHEKIEVLHLFRCVTHTHNLSTHNLCTHNLHTSSHTTSHTTCSSTACSRTTYSHTTRSYTTCPRTTCSHPTSSHTTYSHTTCSHTTYSHTTYSHTTCSHTNYSHTTCSNNLLTHNLSRHNLPAGMALGNIDLPFAWQAWPLATWTCILRGSRGGY